MSTLNATPTVDELVQALWNDTYEFEFSPAEARLFIGAIRKLAEGRPLGDPELDQLAAQSGMAEESAREFLSWIAERGPGGEITGVAGLSLGDWAHKFRVQDRNLTTWCALDTLYLPHILKLPVAIESPDPVSGETVRVEVAVGGVSAHHPESAVLSIVVPQVKEKGLASAEEIWTAFCNYSLYFTSAENASRWFADKSVAPYLLTVEQGFELAGRWFKQVLQYA